MSDTDVFIVGAARTPIGAFMGALAELPAPRLGACAIRGALQRARVSAEQVDLVCMGNVLSAGVGQAPARQAAIYAGIPHAVPAVTISKVCGSGLEAVISAVRTIRSEDAQIVVAGGMESMSGAPYLLTRARAGYRLGHHELVDAMIRDGLWDPYGDFHMGEAAERCAAQLGIGRAEQDAFARESYRRARDAQTSGATASEIVPIAVNDKQKQPTVLELRDDEEPARGELDKLERLRPAFRSTGTITAANASKLNDGAAAIVLASAAACEQHKLPKLARIVAYANHAQAPEQFPTAPVHAIRKAIERAQLDPACVNVRGGAVALGHPIGASGARILTTLLFAMQERGSQRGLATLCIGGGEANALIVERVG